MKTIQCIECDEKLTSETAIVWRDAVRCSHCDRVSRVHGKWEDDLYEQELIDSVA